MGWLKIELSGQEVGFTNRWETIQDGFSTIYMTGGGAVDVAMFEGSESDGATLYFTPAAATLAKDFLISHGAVTCERPEHDDFGLLVGHADSLQMFYSGAIDRE